MYQNQNPNPGMNAQNAGGMPQQNAGAQSGSQNNSGRGDRKSVV